MTWDMQITIIFTSFSHPSTWTSWLLLNNYYGFATITDVFKWHIILSDQYHWSLPVTVLIAWNLAHPLAPPQVRTHIHTHYLCASSSVLYTEWNTECFCRTQILNIQAVNFVNWYRHVVCAGQKTPYSLYFVMISGDVQILRMTGTDVQNIPY